MKFCFDSIDEVKDFVKQLKGTRGGKAGDADEAPAGGQTAPAPLAPPQGGQTFNPQAFAAPAGGAAPGGAFPVAAAPVIPPEVAALVNRIVTVIDKAVAGGQPPDQVLGWFRTQCGPETAAFDMNQIKTIALPKMSVAALENIAKLMNA